MNIARGLELHIRRARRMGSTPANAERAGLLWLRLTVNELRSKLAAKQARELAAALPILEGKALSAADRQAVRDLRIELLRCMIDGAEQARLRPRSPMDPDGKAGLEGKVMQDSNGSSWSREKERDLARFIRRIGGYVEDGGRAGDVLDFDGPHFNRALDLIAGEAEPESGAERRAIERWRAKYPSGAGT